MVSKKRMPRHTLTAALFCVFIGLFYASRVSFFDRMILSEDSCTYVLLARSIWEGHGLSSLWVEGHPAHAKAPFGFPLLLMPFVAWRGVDAGLLTGLMTVVTAGALWAVFLLFKRVESVTVAVAILIVTMLNATVYIYGRSVLSEIPYLFWSLLSLWLIDRYRCGELSAASWLGMALAVLMAFFTRSAGVFLLLAAGFYWLTHHQRGAGLSRALRRHAVAILIVGLPVLWWFYRQWDVSHQTNVSYWKDFIGGNYHGQFSFGGFCLRFLKGAYAFIFYAFPKVLTNMEVHGRSYLMGGLSLVTISGMLWAFFYRRRVMDYYVVLYFLAACAWPWVQISGVRYTAPFIPFVFYYFYLGLKEVWLDVLRFHGSLRSVVAGVILFGLLTVYLAHSPVLFPKTSFGKVKADPLPSTYAWIRRHTPTDAVFVSWTPISLYVYAQRYSADFASSTFNRRELSSLVVNGGVDYVFSDMTMEQSRLILAPVYLKYYRQFQLVYVAGRHRIYRIRKNFPKVFNAGKVNIVKMD